MSCTIQKKKPNDVSTQGCGNCCEYFYPKGTVIFKNCARYNSGFRYCAHCEISVQLDDLRCRCCRQQMRFKARSKTGFKN